MHMTWNKCVQTFYWQTIKFTHHSLTLGSRDNFKLIFCKEIRAQMKKKNKHQIWAGNFSWWCRRYLSVLPAISLWMFCHSNHWNLVSVFATVRRHNIQHRRLPIYQRTMKQLLLLLHLQQQHQLFIHISLISSKNQLRLRSSHWVGYYWSICYLIFIHMWWPVGKKTHLISLK